MYKCDRCGRTGERPIPVNEPDGIFGAVCEHCASDRIRLAAEKCSICGRTLFREDTAYEAGELLICPGCLTEVMI